MLEILQQPNSTQAMIDDFSGDADSDDGKASSEESEAPADDDGDVKMIRAVFNRIKAKESNANKPSDRKKKQVAKVASRRKRVKVVSGKDDYDSGDDKDDDDSSDENDRLRVIDGPLVRLMQRQFQCKGKSDALARQRFEEFGACSMPFEDVGGRLATMVAAAVANTEAVKINGSRTQMIDFARACLDNGSTGTS
jgi:hypothetical protein